jgi:3-(3-hydroxy-phenyl)propionate hydroxylase
MPLLFRDAVLTLARDHAFARGLINAGRLTTATEHVASPLNVPTEDAFAGGPAPGAPFADGPVLEATGRGWLADLLPARWTLLYFHDAERPVPAGLAPLTRHGIDPLVVAASGRSARLHSDAEAVEDADGVLFRKWDARDGTVYLLRPDAHVAARWRALDAAAVRAAYVWVMGGGNLAHGQRRRA